MRPMGVTERDFDISGTLQSLRRILKAMQHTLKATNGFGVIGPRLLAFKMISERNGLSVRELAKEMCLSRAAVTRIVGRLEAGGYVSRDRDTEDRRVVMVRLTSKGTELLRKRLNLNAGDMSSKLRNLRSEELHSIHRSVERLAEIVGAANVRQHSFVTGKEVFPQG